jgi:hypothetical protein
MFIVNALNSARTGAFEYVMGTANTTYTRGEALKMTSGGLVACTSTDTPEFIAEAAAVMGSTATLLPVHRVMEGTEYATTMGAVNGTPAAIVVGTKLTLHTDAATCSYVTTSGVFEVSKVENSGNAVAGDVIYGYFRR